MKKRRRRKRKRRRNNEVELEGEGECEGLNLWMFDFVDVQVFEVLVSLFAMERFGFELARRSGDRWPITRDQLNNPRWEKYQSHNVDVGFGWRMDDHIGAFDCIYDILLCEKEMGLVSSDAISICAAIGHSLTHSLTGGPLYRPNCRHTSSTCMLVYSDQKLSSCLVLSGSS